MKTSRDKLKDTAKDTTRKPTPALVGKGYAREAADAIVKRKKEQEKMIKDMGL